MLKTAEEYIPLENVLFPNDVVETLIEELLMIEVVVPVLFIPYALLEPNDVPITEIKLFEIITPENVLETPYDKAFSVETLSSTFRLLLLIETFEFKFEIPFMVVVCLVNMSKLIVFSEMTLPKPLLIIPFVVAIPDDVFEPILISLLLEMVVFEPELKIPLEIKLIIKEIFVETGIISILELFVIVPLGMLL